MQEFVCYTKRFFDTCQTVNDLIIKGKNVLQTFQLQHFLFIICAQYKMLTATAVETSCDQKFCAI